MTVPRRYSLLCPIARALDRIGDRWTLLILRDLHAGPARFADLQAGLSGIASNLLTDRLRQLQADGLVEKRDKGGGAAYLLTPLGADTKDLLFALALYGARFTPDVPPRKPGNLRTVAVTLAAALEKVAAPEDAVVAGLTIDGEDFTLTVRDGNATVLAAPAERPDLLVKMSYEPMVSAFDNDLDFGRFMTDHVQVETRAAGKDLVLIKLFADIAEWLATRSRQ